MPHHLLSHVPDLQLRRLGDDEPAGLVVTSLPWPRAPAQPPAPATAPPTAEAERLARSTEEGFPWERHLLRLRWGGRSIGLAMGLRHNGEVHWWEACRQVVIDPTPASLTVQ